MKPTRILRLFALLLVPVLSLALAACGDSGGGGGYTLPADFTGVTTQAVVTSGNAETLVLDAFEGGTQSGDLMVVPLDAGAPPAHPAVRKVTDLLADVAVNLPLEPGVSPMTTQTYSGTCVGAEGYYTISINDSGTSASGSIVFADYCDGGVTLSGSMSFAGTADSNGNVTMVMTINNLQSSTLDGSFALSGSYRVSFNAYSENGSMSVRMVFADSVSGETMFVDYTTSKTVGPDLAPQDSWPDYEDVAVSGRFYAHNEGFLAVSTLAPLRTLDGDLDPSSGKLLFSGAEGTWATYEITGLGTYEIVYFDGMDTVTIPSP